MVSAEPLVDPVAVPEAGATFGVEEEFHLVDPETLALAGDRDLAATAMQGQAGERVHAEIATSQLETATAVCSTLAELRGELLRARGEAAAAADRAGLVPLAASTHPFGSWRQQEMTRSARYDALDERYALLPHQQDICGCHVHVAVPDLDTAVAVMDRARPYLCTLAAMTGSSPFHDGLDTGYDSYRTVWFSRWPITGTPERIGDAATFRAVVDGLAAAGTIADASNLYWDVRPSTRYPTVEFRIADVCTDVDDAVLHAALVRSLVRVLAGRAAAGEPCPDPRPELLRAARWRAARHGLGGQLFDPLTGTLLGARRAVRRLLAELEVDLRANGEWAEVCELVARLFRHGTSAARQRRTFARTGDLRAVAGELVCAAPAPAPAPAHGVGVAPWAGAELELDDRLDEAVERDALDDEGDDELVVDGVAASEPLVAVDDGAAGERSSVEVAGAVPVGEDGVAGAVPDGERSASSPRVVVPDEDELVTSADTGFCPTSSIPVTIPIATTKTETA